MRILLAGLLGIAAALSALVFAAARSDFAFRGCPDLPRAEWAATANCADGWFAQVLFGSAALGCLGLALAIGFRGRLA